MAADKNLDSKSIAEALVELTKAKGTYQEILALTKQYNSTLSLSKNYVEDMEETLNGQARAAKELLLMSTDTRRTQQEMLATAKIAENIEESLLDIARDRAQAEADLLLKQTMLKTGLTGNYAEQAKNLMLAKQLGAITESQYQKQLAGLQVEQKRIKHLAEEVELTEEIANWQLELNEELESYSMGWEKIKSKIKAVVTDPQVAKAVFLTSMVEKSHEVYENFEKLGQSGLTVGQRVDYMTKGFSLMSAMGLSDTKGVLDGMVETMGTMNSLTSAEVDHVGHLAKEMGVTGQEAFGLVEGFSKLPGETMETATHAADYVKSLSKANGVAPVKIAREVAKNTELIALGGYKGAKAFADAAMKAQKMGVELQTTSKVMNGLLNFENSLNKQMEASVLLGKEINLDKARQLALEGKSVEATEEVLKNIGGQAAFDKMNVLQKQALAEATGMTVEELNKAVDAQVEYNKYHGESVSGWKTLVGYGMEFGGAAVKIGKEYGMMALSLIQMVVQMRMMKAMQGGGGKGIFGGLFGKGSKAPTPELSGGGGGPEDKAGSMSKINGAKLLQAAAAMLVAAAAIFVFGKAVQELDKVKDWVNVSIGLGLFVAALGAVAAISYFAAPALYLAAPAIIAFGAAVTLFGLGLNLATPAIEAFGKVFTSISQNIGALLALGPALMMIGAGLSIMSIAGLGALPVIAALAGLAVVAPALTGLGNALGDMFGGGEGEKEDKMDELIAEVRALRVEVSKGGTVNMDGKKVGDALRLYGIQTLKTG